MYEGRENSFGSPVDMTIYWYVETHKVIYKRKSVPCWLVCWPSFEPF